MYQITIKREDGTTEVAVIDGRKIVDGHFEPERDGPYEESIPMWDTIDLIRQFGADVAESCFYGVAPEGDSLCIEEVQC